MCNLYTSKKSAAEIAAHFKAEMPTLFNVAEGDIYPGGPGLVVREQDGRRILQAMTWGFPARIEEQEDRPADQAQAGQQYRRSFQLHVALRRAEARKSLPHTA